MIRRILRKLAWAAAFLITAAALFYAVENWRGARAWAETRRQLEAQGESLNPDTFIPPPVPDDQNLAMAPLFVRALNYQPDPQSGELAARPPYNPPTATRKLLDDMPYGHVAYPDKSPPTGSANWQTAQRRDLAKWQEYYRQRKDFPKNPEPQSPAADILLAQTRYAPTLDELAQEAAARPLSRFPVAWRHDPTWDIALPHYNDLQKLSSTLALRALAELDLNQSGEAARDIGLALRLRKAAASDPTIIAILVATTQTSGTLQPLWEGLLDRKWSAAELARFQETLSGIDALAEYARGIRGGERALFMCASLDQLKRNNRLVEFVHLVARDQGTKPYNDLGADWKIALAPTGWIDQNKAAGCRYYQTAILDVFDPAAHRVWPARSAAAVRDFDRATSGPYGFLVKMVAPVFNTLLIKVAWAQTIADEAAVACALERHYLDHHAYPDRLEALTPAYLPKAPVDVIDGAPLRYRLTPDGRYQLYSIGWNEKDDGGTPGDAPNAISKGDWVWQYTPEVAASKRP